MTFDIQIQNIDVVDEIKNYWTNDDYKQLLERFDFPDAHTIKPENLKEMLFMAIGDFEPNEAAEVVLTYKLSDRLNEGQIAQISNDMLIDKVCEEYPEIDLHYPLYAINQLLYKAYNGKFPSAKALVVDFSMIPKDQSEQEVTKEVVLKTFNDGLADNNLIKRLFEEQMTTDKSFENAEYILWELNNQGDHKYQLITSEYWINKEDILRPEFEGTCKISEDRDTEDDA
ncbi:hypothetical protein [Riemerella columbina]|uniref:hypothetical protein n=1 Tax=Riemerella columbina TaxID=103810 RepID=UPI00037E26FB|nr:hypothetical protein [Riemerella columbina]